MSHESSRRPSMIPFASIDSVPSAPPLPAPRPLQRARDAATRLFRYGSRPPSPQEDEKVLHGGRTRFASLSATQNATASHKTGLEINTVAINEAGTHALLGGKEIFKTVKVEDGICAEERNLRSAIRSNPLQASGKTRQIYSINIADVAWAKGDCGDFVAAATSSGKIILYDLGHAGLQAAQLHEHFRQVHKVTFNPHRGNLLLSGSQDGTVRLWDVRDVRQASTLKSKHKYSGQADGIRDVKWSPTEGVDFAFGTDSGWIQRWDMRNLKTAKLKIPAHVMTCNAIDWHPDGKHIASASADKTVRVWDFSVNKRQKASYEIRAPHPVLNARWRPSCETSTPYESGARQCTQLVTAYDSVHSGLHIWDLRRPLLPFRELSPYPTAPTDLLWHSQDLLWTVGREGVFLQTDIHYATKTITKRSLQAVAVSPQGEINLITQRRHRSRPLKAHGLGLLQYQSSTLSQSPEKGAISRSWADDGLDHSFLSVPPTRQPIHSNAKSRTQSLSLTAASSEMQLHLKTAHLDDVISHRKSFRPIQAACRGWLPKGLHFRAFKYLARNLKAGLDEAFAADDFTVALGDIFETNSRCYQDLGMYRLAQSWRITKLVVIRHLEERASTKRQRSVSQLEPVKNGTRLPLSRIARKHLKPHIVSPISSPPSAKPISAIAQQLAHSDSASNQRTPQARPSSNPRVATLHGQELAELDNKDRLMLPPLVVPHVPQENHSEAQQAPSDSQLTRSNLDGLQRQQPATGVNRADMVRRWSIQPKEPLNLDPDDSKGIQIAPRLQKHDSNESFAFLEESFDSRGPSFPSSYASHGSGSGGPLQMVAERPSRPGDSKNIVTNGIETTDFAAGHNGLSAPVAKESPVAESARDEMKMYSATEMAIAPNQSSPVEYDYLPYGIDPASYPDENVVSPLLKAPSAQPPLDKSNVRSRGNQIQPPAATQVEVPVRSSSRLSVEKATSQQLSKLQSVYLPDYDDIDIEEDKPFTVREMLQELAFHYTKNGDAQTAAHLLLLIAPLLQRTQSLTLEELEATIAVYLDSLPTVGFESENVEEILDEYFDPLISSGVQPLQIEAVLETYHTQLQQSGLLNEAATLRKLSYPVYPSVYDQALKDNYIHLRCGACGKPMTTGMAQLRCETCDTKQESCPVCWCDTNPFDVANTGDMTLTNLITTCLLCNHSGHAACLRAWFQDSDDRDGGCPMPGCLCDCTSGLWRAEKMRIAEKKRRSRSHHRIRSDDWSVRESKAVEDTRKVLGLSKAKDGRAVLTSSA